MNGNSHGRLKVYMAVNGKKGSPLLTRYGTASSDVHWFREQLYIHAVAQSPSDMIEVCQYMLESAVCEKLYIQTVDQFSFI